MPSVDELFVDTPDAPDSGQNLPGGALGQLTYLEYVISFLSPNVVYSGEVRPLRWQIARADGIQCDPPSTGSVTIYDELGLPTGDAGPAELDPAPGALVQVIGSLFTVPMVTSGTTLLARLVVGLTGGETRIDEQIIVVKP